MAFSKNERDELKKFLLGQIHEDQRQKIEQRLLTDDDYFEELEIVEDELVDEYVAGNTTSTERRIFEEQFLVSDERRGKLRFANVLAGPIAVAKSVELSWAERLKNFWTSQGWALRAATVGAFALVVVAVIWLAQPPSPKTFASLALTISTSERSQGGVATKLKLPIEADAQRLQLNLPEGVTRADRYRVELIRENGQSQKLTPVEQTQQAVVVEIPADQLSRGQYALNLYAIKPDGTDERIKGSFLLTAE